MNPREAYRLAGVRHNKRTSAVVPEIAIIDYFDAMLVPTELRSEP